MADTTSFKVLAERTTKALKVTLLDPPEQICAVERFQIERHGDVLYFAPGIFGSTRDPNGMCRIPTLDSQERKVIYLPKFKDLILEDGRGIVLDARIVENPKHLSKYLQYTRPIFEVTFQQQEEPDAQHEPEPEDYNVGVLMAKVSVMSEQINDLMAIVQKDHEQLMQLTPYIQHWSAIRKRLQLWKVEKGGAN